MPFVSQALWSLLFLMLYTGFSTVGMHTESKIPCSFTFLAPFFSLFFFPFSSSTSFAGHLLGTIFFGNGFGQTFGIVGLDGRKQRGLATAFDLAAFLLSMIAPVKKSVNHSRTVASMRETGWEQQQQVVTFAHASSLLGRTCWREIVMAERRSEALSREIFLHT